MNKNTIFLTIIILISTIILCFAIFPPCVADVKEGHTFVVDRPYKESMRLLAKNDALEKIVEMGNGRVVEKHWNKLDLNIQKLINPEWKIIGDANFSVEIEDYQHGKVILDLKQTADISPEKMIICVNSVSPSGGVKLVSNYFAVFPEVGNKTKFILENRLVIGYKIPANYHNRMHEMVKNVNHQNLLNVETCVREIVSKKGISISLQP